MRMLLIVLPIVIFSSWIALGSYPVAAKPWTRYLQTVHVYLINEINFMKPPPHPTLFARCKSNEDDLHVHKIVWGDQMDLKFKANILGSTYWRCDIWWEDSKGNHSVSDFYLYNYQRDANKCHHNDCYWLATGEGMVFKFGNELSAPTAWEPKSIHPTPVESPPINWIPWYPHPEKGEFIPPIRRPGKR